MRKLIHILIVLTAMILVSCYKNLANVSEGNFNVFEPPIIVPQITYTDSVASIYAVFSHQIGGVDTIKILGLNNKSVESTEGGVLPWEKAEINYIVNQATNTLYFNLSKPIFKDDKSFKKFISGQIGILPFPFVGLSFTSINSYFGIGTNAYIGKASTKANYRGAYTYDVGGIDGGWSVDGVVDNYATTLSHYNSGMGVYTSVKYKHLSFDYYGGLYYPWIFSQVSYVTKSGVQAFDLSFDFPYMCINRIQMTYEIINHVVMSTGFTMYSGRDFSEVERQLHFEIQLKK